MEIKVSLSRARSSILCNAVSGDAKVQRISRTLSVEDHKRAATHKREFLELGIT